MTVTRSKKASTGWRRRASAAIASPNASRSSAVAMSSPTALRRKNSVCSSLASRCSLVRLPGVGSPIPLLLDPHDVAGAAQRSQQVGAVVGREKRAERLGPGQQTDQIVLLGGGEHGADQVVAHPGVLEVHLEPVGEERQQLRAQGAGIAALELITVSRERLPEGLAQRQTQAVLQDQPDRPQGGAAQSERILGAGRLLADGEEADQGVELVGERHGDALRRARAAVAGPLRRVVLGDRDGDLGWLAVVEGVVRPMTPCSSGNSLTMSVTRSALHSNAARVASLGLAAGTRSASQPASVSSRTALAPSEPSLAWNTTPSRSGTRLDERSLAVVIPEELRIEEPRLEHALVAGDDRVAARRGLEVGHHDEARRQPAFGVLDAQDTSDGGASPSPAPLRAEP